MSCPKNSKNLTMAEVMGGLGNQMFIYAFARAQQLQYGGRCVLVARGDGPVAHCALGLEALCISPEVELCRDADAMKKTLPLQNAVRALALKQETRRGIMSADLSGFEKSVRPLLNAFGVHLATEGYLPCRRRAVPRALLAWGYFQSEGFFAPFRETICAELTPREIPQGDFADALAEISARGGRTVCVHVRRGDYLRPENAALQVCTPRYYRRAMAAAETALPGCTFVFFSDDMPWVKQNLAPDTAPALYAPEGGSAANDLALMLRCTDFILSNSTFSWWAQELSTTATQNVENSAAKSETEQALPKQVFAPGRWYANEKKTGLYQDFWRLVPTEDET